jgi:hypothetical protein
MDVFDSIIKESDRRLDLLKLDLIALCEQAQANIETRYHRDLAELENHFRTDN